MRALVRTALIELFGDRVVFDVPMARHTSLRVGGPAEALATPENVDDVIACAGLCQRFAVPLLAVGGGFNLLVRDGGLSGVVLRTAKLRGIALQDGRLVADAGVSHSQIARFCGERGLHGLEFGAGIPGSVGGWIAMNAGVPAREVADAVWRVEIASAAGIELRDADAMAFSYRAARGLAAGEVAVRAHFAVEPAAPTEVRGQIEAHLRHRRLTQPVDQPSCGSVFKNPPGEYAGQLIEAAGQKGARVGGAAISTLHANFIVTERGARAADVLALIEQAQEAVLTQTGLLLEPEVRILGEPA